MNIMLEAPPEGNAVAIAVSLSPGVDSLQVQRRTDNRFDEPSGATIIYNGPMSPVPRASMGLRTFDLDVVNGTTYWYIAYGRQNNVWLESEPRSITPALAFLDRTVDPLTLLRDRLTVGLQAEVAAGRLHPPSGQIPVWTAPPQADNTPWPVVTLKLVSDSSVERYLGEQVDGDQQDISGGWVETQGWLSRVTIQVVGWALNPDERIHLRLALKRLIIGNIPVFVAGGLYSIDWNQQDSEDFESFAAPVYLSTGTFSCLSQSALAGQADDIKDIVIENDYG